VQTYFSATAILWEGTNLASSLAAALERIQSVRPALLIDTALHDKPIVEDALATVTAASVQLRSGGEPDTDEADRVAEALRTSQCDAVVGIGGGSVLDLAKAVAGLIVAPGTAADYQGFNLLPGPAMPVVAIPTTAGTGSEVTGTAVLVNRAKSLKLGINSPHIVPAVAVLEPGLLLGTPRRLSLSSGMDAISHAVESYSALRANEITRSLSIGAFRLLVPTLHRVLDDPDNLHARRSMLVGSTMAGLAVMNAGTGAAHAMAYPLGVHLGVPHSEALTMLLPEVARSSTRSNPGV
jgi:alcohol dehydrogenase